MNSQPGAGLEPFKAAGVNLYRDNAFRLSGLPTDATPRQVRRRLTELEAARRLGIEPPPTTGILPPAIHPGLDATIEALGRLRDPVRRLWEELLWLWPLPGGGHGHNSLEEARSHWVELAASSPEAGHVARHNLAVVDHVTALELDRDARGNKAERQ